MGTVIFLGKCDGDYSDWVREECFAEAGMGRWHEIQKLLPLLIDYVNRSMEHNWAGVSRNMLFGVASDPIGDANNNEDPPTPKKFVIGEFITDYTDSLSEVYLTDGRELLRLFAWCDFLSQRDGAFEFYIPLLQTLRSYTQGLEELVNSQPE